MPAARESAAPTTVGVPASVSSTDRQLERQRAEILGIVVAAHLLAATVTEDVLLVPAPRTDVDAHVLDQAENRDADLLEHLQPLARIDEGDVLRVVTITAPVTGTFCDRVSCVSPVPGGMSTSR